MDKPAQVVITFCDLRACFQLAQVKLRIAVNVINPCSPEYDQAVALGEAVQSAYQVLQYFNGQMAQSGLLSYA